MNTALNHFFELIEGREVAVIGIGISNRPLIEYLVRHGASVTACDQRTQEELSEAVEALSKMGVKFRLGSDYLEELGHDIIFRTPGMRFDVPQLEAARQRGAVVTSEMEVFFDVCPSPVIAVTGSDGKTTTTTIIHEMLEEQGYRTWLGGNIGRPLLCDVEKMQKEDWVVLELSSFQLHTLQKSPEIAVVTNITPNHLDYHKDYEEYIDAKKNIMRYQSKGDILVANAGNEEARKIGEEAKGEWRCFNAGGDALIHLRNDRLYYGDEEILQVEDIKIPGRHNVENYMAAIGAVHGLVETETIRHIARTFGGVEHRIELVREFEGVKYYNSSIDSSPNRTMNTLAVFPQKVILIAGGKDKGIPYDGLGAVLEEHVKTLILTGATAHKINADLTAHAKTQGTPSEVEVIFVQDYTEAVNTAREKAVEGDVVLLSPASTSFDRFRNFEERGRLFKQLVNAL